MFVIDLKPTNKYYQAKKIMMILLFRAEIPPAPLYSVLYTVAFLILLLNFEKPLVHHILP